MRSRRSNRQERGDLLLAVISSENMEGNRTGAWRWLRPEILEDACNGCGRCVLLCPDLCIKLQGKRAKIDYTYCKGCGICAYECKHRAIVMLTE